MENVDRIPGHDGNLRNEKVDLLAKKEAENHKQEIVGNIREACTKNCQRSKKIFQNYEPLPISSFVPDGPIF